MATPRSNSVCTLGSHDVGKLTLPSISSCWLRTLVLSTIVIRLAPIIRYFGFMAFSHRKRGCARPSYFFASAKKKNCTYLLNNGVGTHKFGLNNGYKRKSALRPKVSILNDVRFGSKADMCSAQARVRFTPIATAKADIGK